jgi:hypothetical protein
VAAVLVDSVEHRAGQAQDLVVAAGHGQAAQDNVEAGGFGCVVALVVQVGLVDDRRDPPQDRVVQVVGAQDGLEAAVAGVVGQLGAGDVERVAPAGISAGSATKANSASGSMWRRMSHAQAARSMWMCSRVAP